MDPLFPGFASIRDLHPMVVHFPIAFWVAATVVWGIGLVGSDDATWKVGLRLHWAGAVSAVLALTMGFWAANKMGHDSPGHDLVHVHRNLMVTTTALGISVAAFGAWRLNKKIRWRVPLFIASLLLSGILAAGADRGAALVYGYGVGVSTSSSETFDHAHGHADQR